MNTLQIISCPLCRSKNLQYLFESRDRMHNISGKFGIKKCMHCQSYVLTPRPLDLSRYYPKNNYYAYTQTTGGFFTKLRNYLVKHYYKPTIGSKLLSVFIHNVPALPSTKTPGKILDVGCGTGDTLLQLKDLGWQVYGMDIDKKAVNIAHKRGVDHVRVGIYEDIATYPDNYFDAIRLYHVIEHLDDPQKCVALIYKKLKKGGEIILGTPNAGSVASHVFKTYWYNLDSPRHLVLFTPTNLAGIVTGVGFRIQAIEFCSAGGIVGSLQYMIKDKWGISIDLIHSLPAVLLMYPLEWVLDKVGLGDVFVLRGIK